MISDPVDILRRLVLGSLSTGQVAAIGGAAAAQQTSSKVQGAPIRLEDPVSKYP